MYDFRDNPQWARDVGIVERAILLARNNPYIPTIEIAHAVVDEVVGFTSNAPKAEEALNLCS